MKDEPILTASEWALLAVAAYMWAGFASYVLR